MLQKKDINRLLRPSGRFPRLSAAALWVVLPTSLVVFLLGATWLFDVVLNRLDQFGPYPDATNLEIFTGIVGFIVGALTLWTASRTENATEVIHEFLARSWAGIQTDYGRNLPSTINPVPEIERHIDDLSRGLCVPHDIPLNDVHLMLSSFAYGIENGSRQLSRFFDVVDHVVRHPLSDTDLAFRRVSIAIWPMLEHQAIWGADRAQLVERWSGGGHDRRLSPALLELASGDAKASKEWRRGRPNWCKSKSRASATIRQLKRFGEILVFCRNHASKVKLDIQEIDQWTGRAFFCKFGFGEYFTLLIATTPINSRTLSSEHWTTIGFSTNAAASYAHLCRLYDTCVRARHSYNEPTMSEPNADQDIRSMNTDESVRNTARFLAQPYETIGEYFCLPDGWQGWKRSDFDKFYASLGIDGVTRNPVS